MFEFGQSEGFEEWRQVHPEPTPVPLSVAVPSADGVGFAATPRLDRPFPRGLVLVRRAKRDPVALLAQPVVKILDRARLVGQLCAADLTDELVTALTESPQSCSSKLLRSRGNASAGLCRW